MTFRNLFQPWLEWRWVTRKAARAHADLFSVELSPALRLTDDEKWAFMTVRHLLNDIETGKRLPHDTSQELSS